MCTFALLVGQISMSSYFIIMTSIYHLSYKKQLSHMSQKLSRYHLSVLAYYNSLWAQISSFSSHHQQVLGWFAELCLASLALSLSLLHISTDSFYPCPQWKLRVCRSWTCISLRWIVTLLFRLPGSRRRNWRRLCNHSSYPLAYKT